MTTSRKAIGGLRRILITAVFANVVLITNASATQSSYDSLADLAVTFTLPAGVTAGPTSISLPTLTQSGDGMLSGAFTVDTGSPPGFGMVLHAFGTGTGSSAIDAFESFDISGPSTTYMIVVDLTFMLSVDAFNAPGGSAFAEAEENFGIAGATMVDCLTGAPTTELCYDAQGTVTARLEGLVSGNAVTPVPEPATLALLGLGLAGLGFPRRKQ